VQTVLAAMIQDVRLVAASVFQGIGKNGQVLESSCLVYRPSQLDDRAAAPGSPVLANKDSASRAVKDVTEQITLRVAFGNRAPRT
jgi:hypothetical protein